MLLVALTNISTTMEGSQDTAHNQRSPTHRRNNENVR